MNISPNMCSGKSLIKAFVVAAVIGYLFTVDSSQARVWSDQQQPLSPYQEANLNQQVNELQAQYNNLQGAINSNDAQSNLDRLDSDDDDDDDDRIDQLQPAALPVQQAGSQVYQTSGVQQPQFPIGGAANDALTPDLRTAASKHYGHHKHGAKGWLDMGAWTGKKGAFGWYDKHPVGKGK